LEPPNAEAPGNFRAKGQEGAVDTDDRIPECGATDRTEATPWENAAFHQRAGSVVRQIHTNELNLLVEVDIVQAQLKSGH
jgi:hypothetical protein